MLNQIFCPICSGELAPTTYESYLKETYYICPSCQKEFTVEAGETNLIIKTDLNDNDYQ